MPNTSSLSLCQQRSLHAAAGHRHDRVSSSSLFHVHAVAHTGSEHRSRTSGGGQFDPEHAASSTAIALQPLWIQMLYAIGMLSCVYHFANGLWTQGITWGIWTTPRPSAGPAMSASSLGVGAGRGRLERPGRHDASRHRQAKADRRRAWRARKGHRRTARRPAGQPRRDNAQRTRPGWPKTTLRHRAPQLPMHCSRPAIELSNWSWQNNA